MQTAKSLIPELDVSKLKQISPQIYISKDAPFLLTGHKGAWRASLMPVVQKESDLPKHMEMMSAFSDYIAQNSGEKTKKSKAQALQFVLHYVHKNFLPFLETQSWPWVPEAQAKQDGV